MVTEESLASCQYISILTWSQQGSDRRGILPGSCNFQKNLGVYSACENQFPAKTRQRYMPNITQCDQITREDLKGSLSDGPPGGFVRLMPGYDQCSNKWGCDRRSWLKLFFGYDCGKLHCGVRKVTATCCTFSGDGRG